MLSIEELLVLGIIKLFAYKSIITLKIEITRNKALLNIINDSGKEVDINSEETIRILDARSLAYYIKDACSLEIRCHCFN